MVSMYNQDEKRHLIPHTGRPKGVKSKSAGLAAAIRETIDPEDLRDWAEKVWLGALTFPKRDSRGQIIRDDQGQPIEVVPTLEQRTEAHHWLAERGWGRALSFVEISIDQKATNPLMEKFALLDPADQADVMRRLETDLDSLLAKRISGSPRAPLEISVSVDPEKPSNF